MGFICAVCREKKGALALSYTVIIKPGEEYLLCNECSKQYNALDSSEFNVSSQAWEYLEEKLRTNPQMELSLRERVQDCLLKSKKRHKELEENRKIHNNIPTLLKTMPQTTGYSFEGYRIMEYCGVLCAEVVLGTGFFSEWSAGVADLFGERSNAFESKLEEARRAAMRRLIEKVALAGGNAIIGVDFDYINFSGNLMGVIVNGTAVRIVPEGEPAEQMD